MENAEYFLSLRKTICSILQ